jgi:hypothetical protein
MSQDLFFILLDAARMGGDILNAKGLNPDFDSLYRGKSEAHLAAVSPYLFSIQHNTEFENWFLQKGWGDSWGILVFSNSELKTLVKHFRQFLMILTEDKKDLYFRFYDPRVLRIFLPTCNREQLKEFFGPVEYFVCEDEEPGSALIFSLHDEELKIKRITKDEVIAFNPVFKKKKFLFF